MLGMPGAVDNKVTTSIRNNSELKSPDQANAVKMGMNNIATEGKMEVYINSTE